MDRNVIDAVKLLREEFSDSNIMGMRKLGNSLIEVASAENNKLLADVALIAYSLHKLSSKGHISGHETWLRVKGRVISSLKRAENALEKDDSAGFDKIINGIKNDINGVDSKLGYFVQGIHEKARVKYASTAYSLGLSLSQATDLTGASKKKVLEYVGATKISDKEKSEFGIGERLDKLRKVL
jgi:hypothetical protein